jgi:hypothetical protein
MRRETNRSPDQIRYVASGIISGKGMFVGEEIDLK